MTIDIKMPIWPHEIADQKSKQQMWENGFKEGCIAYELAIDRVEDAADDEAIHFAKEFKDGLESINRHMKR